MEIKTGWVSNSLAKNRSCSDLIISRPSSKTRMGSVGNQKSKSNPGTIRLRAIDKGARNTSVKKSF